MIKVFTLQLEEVDYTPEFQDSLLQYLPEAGRLRVKDRLNTISRLHTVAGELLARYAIVDYTGNPKQEIILRFGEKGKPYIENLPEIFFNISHSGHYIVCAIAKTEIGIDVERVRKVNLRVAERFFSETELHDLMACNEEYRMLYFITLWTIKESYLKAIGRGLTQKLNSFTIVRHGDSYSLSGNTEAEEYGIEVQQLSTEYMMAVCSPKPYSPFATRSISWQEITQTLPKHI